MDGKIPFNVLREQAWGCIQCTEDPEYNSIDKITEEEATEVASSYIANESYDSLLGGDVYICEVSEDLQQLTGVDYEFFEEMKRWPNILDMPLDADICTFVKDQPDFILFLVCTNNAGGHSFFVPKHLWVENLIATVNDEDEELC
jgi:hypothetical protein